MPDTVLTVAKQEKLQRIGSQLMATHQLLENHALTQDKFGFVRSTLYQLNLQTRWVTATKLSNLLMGLESGLYGIESEKSKTGFIGPYLKRFHQITVRLMDTCLPPNSTGIYDILNTTTHVLLLTAVYTATQILGNWKKMFPHTDPAAAIKGGMLYQELGLIWLFGSHTIKHLFKSLTNEMNLDERKQNIISEIGTFYILVILFIATENEGKPHMELLESLQRYMEQSIDSIEHALQVSVSRNSLDEDTAMTAASHLQLLRRSFENNDVEAITQTIHSGFHAFGIPFKGIQNDIKQLNQFCSQLNITFENIFYQVDKTVTSVDQAA